MKSSDRAALLLLALAAALLLYPLDQTYQDCLHDEGSFTESAFRMYCGQVPHRDFHTHFPHLPSLCLLLAYLVFGVSLFSAHVVGMVQFTVLSWIVYANARLRSGPRVAFLAAFTILNFSMLSWPIVSHHWMATGELLVFYFCLMRLLQGGSPGYWLGVGVALGLTLLTAQNSFVVGCGVLVCFVVCHRGQLPAPRLLPAGLAFALVPYFGALAICGALGGYLADNFGILGGLYSHYRTAFESQLAWKSLTDLVHFASRGGGTVMEWAAVWTYVYSLAGLFYIFLAALGLAAVCVFSALRRRDVPVLWLAFLGGAHGGLLLSYHMIPTYFNFVFPFLTLLCVAGIPPRLRFLPLALALLANSFSWAILTSIQASFRYPIVFRSGTLYSMSEQDARDVNQLQQLVARACRAGEPIFFSPAYRLSQLSALLQKPNACRYFNLYHYLASGHLEAATEVLEEVRRVRPPVLILAKLSREAREIPLEPVVLKLYDDLIHTADYKPVLASNFWLVYVRPDRL